VNARSKPSYDSNVDALIGQARVLELIAADTPIDIVLLEICKLVEDLDPQSIAGIHVVDASRGVIDRTIGPRLPQTLIDACREWPLGHPDRMGNCTLALAKGGPVACFDAAADRTWSPAFKAVAAAHGVQAMLSTPLIRNDGVPLGSLFAARTEPVADRSAWNTQVIDLAAKLAGLALEREASAQKFKELHEALEQQVAERTRERDRIWHNSRDLLLVVGDDGVLRAVNPAWTAILGYAPEELIGHRFDLFSHPDDIEPTFSAVAHAARNPLAHFENRYRHKDGSYRWFAWKAAPEEGLIYANGRDITTEKKQAEQLLMADEARLQLALEAGEMGAWHWNIQTNESFWFHGMAAVHGLPPGTVPASMDDYARYIHPDDRDYVSKAIGQALAERKDHRVEYRIVWPDGRVHWVEGRGKIILDDCGMPAQMAGICADITRRKRTEQDLKFLAQASAELAGLVDPQSTLDKLAYLAVPSFADWCAVDLLEENGTLKRVAVAHVAPEKVELARQLHRRFPPDPNAPGGVWNVVHTGQAELVSEITEEMLGASIKDQEYLTAMRELGLRSYIGVPLSAQGKTLGVVTFIGAESGRVYGAEDLALAEDLARRAAIAMENANLYRASRQSDHGKDIFLATLAHELRNPLAPIANALSIMKLAANDRNRVEQSSRIIERQVSHLTRLVDDMMDISRITHGKIELRKEHTSLASILNSAVETSRPLIEAAQHTLMVALPEQPTPLCGDPVRLAQVFANLLNNAAKYTNRGGMIDVLLEYTSAGYVVRVKDSGIGIPAGMQRNIFSLFAQVTHPLERSQGGLGIGLSLVEGLVKMHGGRVEVFSKGPEQGSEFVVHLPRSLEDIAHVSTDRFPDPEEEKPAARSILVVDDNVDGANTVAEILKMLGHEVAVVHDGLAAVATASEMKPDIVLLDIGLPGIDGYEAARRIRAREDTRRTVLVALTGWGQEKDKQRAIEAGFDEHLVKPVGLDRLMEIFARY
jgi:PAS domain S-box-containing protein